MIHIDHIEDDQFMLYVDEIDNRMSEVLDKWYFGEHRKPDYPSKGYRVDMQADAYVVSGENLGDFVRDWAKTWKKRRVRSSRKGGL